MCDATLRSCRDMIGTAIQISLSIDLLGKFQPFLILQFETAILYNMATILCHVMAAGTACAHVSVANRGGSAHAPAAARPLAAARCQEKTFSAQKQQLNSRSSVPVTKLQAVRADAPAAEVRLLYDTLS